MGGGITEADFVGEEKVSQRSSWVWEKHSSVAGAALCPWLFLSSPHLLLARRKKKVFIC